MNDKNLDSFKNIFVNILQYSIFEIRNTIIIHYLYFH
jgi:hypothetical protein